MKNIILALLAILTILNIYNYQKTKKELEKEYGKISINLETGEYTEIKEEE